MTTQEKKDNKYWKVFNYFLMAWSCEHSAHAATFEELGYNPIFPE